MFSTCILSDMHFFFNLICIVACRLGVYMHKNVKEAKMICAGQVSCYIL